MLAYPRRHMDDVRISLRETSCESTVSEDRARRKYLASASEALEIDSLTIPTRKPEVYPATPFRTIRAPNCSCYTYVVHWRIMPDCIKSPAEMNRVRLAERRNAEGITNLVSSFLSHVYSELWQNLRTCGSQILRVVQVEALFPNWSSSC